MTVIGEARIARAGWAAGASLLALAIAGAGPAAGGPETLVWRRSRIMAAPIHATTRA